MRHLTHLVLRNDVQNTNTSKAQLPPPCELVYFGSHFSLDAHGAENMKKAGPWANPCRVDRWVTKQKYGVTSQVFGKRTRQKITSKHKFTIKRIVGNSKRINTYLNFKKALPSIICRAIRFKHAACDLNYVTSVEKKIKKRIRVTCI